MKSRHFNTSSLSSATAQFRKNVPAETRAELVARFMELIESGFRSRTNDMLRNFKGLANALREKDADGNVVLETALHVAVMKGHLGIAQDLVMAGAVVDAQNANGETPLHLAAEAGRADIVKFLLSKNADPNHLAAEGFTPLMYAVRSASVPAVKHLFAHQAKPDLQNDHGNTALHYAMFIDNEDEAKKMIEALIIRGANAELKNKREETPVDSAFCLNKPEVAAFAAAWVDEMVRAEARAEALRPENRARAIRDNFTKGTGRQLAPPAPASFTRKKTSQPPSAPVSP